MFLVALYVGFSYIGGSLVLYGVEHWAALFTGNPVQEIAIAWYAVCIVGLVLNGVAVPFGLVTWLLVQAGVLP